MAIAPDAASAIDQFPSWVNRIIGLSGLAAICGYLIWLTGRQRVVGVKGVCVTLPSAPLTFVQILIGVADLGLSAVIVTHDLAVARLLADRMLVMQGGRIVEAGLTDQVLDDPQHPYSQLLVSSVLQA